MWLKKTFYESINFAILLIQLIRNYSGTQYSSSPNAPIGDPGTLNVSGFPIKALGNDDTVRYGDRVRVVVLDNSRHVSSYINPV